MHSLHATSLWCRTPNGCMALADIQTHQRLAQDSPVHLHPELTLQPFLHRRRSQQWLLTDNGTAPPCYLRPTDSCSNFSEISHSHHVASAVWFMLPSSVWSLLLNCLADSGPRWPHSLSVCQLSRDIWYHLLIGVVTEWLDARIWPKKCTIWAPSMSLASASWKSAGQSTSQQDSKSDLWRLLSTPCLDSDGGQSTFSTSNRRSLLPTLTCIVMYSCPSKCMSSLVLSTCLLLLGFLCRLQGRLILFILIGVWNIVLQWYWPWQTVGFIWNCKQIAEHSNSWHLQYYVFRQGKGSSRIPCPDRIRLHILVFWHGNEICLRKMEHAARAHNHALLSDG